MPDGRFTLAGIAPEPWRNGGGWTRVIASDADACGASLWRVSVADLTGPGPFSRFEGLERQALLLDGPALRLEAQSGSDATAVDFDAPGCCRHFPGEWALQVRELTQAARLWNVMTRRGTWQACTQRLPLESAAPLRLSTAHHHIVLLTAGEAELQTGPSSIHQLPAGDGWVLAADTAGQLRATRPGTQLIHTALWRV
jgi:environmental stress-induced protein Ves